MQTEKNKTVQGGFCGNALHRLVDSFGWTIKTGNNFHSGVPFRVRKFNSRVNVPDMYTQKKGVPKQLQIATLF